VSRGLKYAEIQVTMAADYNFLPLAGPEKESLGYFPSPADFDHQSLYHPFPSGSDRAQFQFINLAGDLRRVCSIDCHARRKASESRGAFSGRPQIISSQPGGVTRAVLVGVSAPGPRIDRA